MRGTTLAAVAALLLLAPLALAEEAADDQDPIEALRENVDGILKSLRITFYGHFKLDMSRDTAETNFGDTAFFVKDYSPGARDEEINVTARHTRLGLNWDGPEDAGIKAFGNVEMDFLGKAVQKNTETMELQSAARLRHAYMRFDFGGGWSLLAGQTWDVFGRLNMKKLNTLVGWGQGNIGFRRPQLRGSKKLGIGEGASALVDLAIARPVARDSTNLDGDAQDDGEDAGVPDVMANVGFTIPSPLVEKKKASFGVGGVLGWREVGGGSAALADDHHYKTSAVVLDATMPLLEDLDLFGELWRGKALDGYRGGVWQSYVIDRGKVRTISAWGGFVNVVWRPVRKWMVVAGYGVDDPKNGDFKGVNGRYDNTTLFANVRWSFYRGATVGIEYDRMNTDYRDRRGRTNHRVQCSFMLKF